MPIVPKHHVVLSYVLLVAGLVGATVLVIVVICWPHFLL